MATCCSAAFREFSLHSGPPDPREQWKSNCAAKKQQFVKVYLCFKKINQFSDFYAIMFISLIHQFHIDHNAPVLLPKI